MALADARDDRVIAVDANPDRGTLAERIARSSGQTVRDLVQRALEVTGLQRHLRRSSRATRRGWTCSPPTPTRASPKPSATATTTTSPRWPRTTTRSCSPTRAPASCTRSWGRRSTSPTSSSWSSGLSVDEARLASETLTWLETNGYAEQVRNAVVVLNNARPGHAARPPGRARGALPHARAQVVRVPYDPHIAAGSAISFRDLQPATRLAARELAASVVEGLRALAPAA